MKNILRNISLSILSGVLMFLAFPPVEWAPLAWVCLVPLFFVVKKSRSARERFLYSYLAGVAFFGLLLYWLVNVTVPGAIILVLFLAVFWGLFGICAGIVFKYSMDALTLPLLWIVIEYIRANIFSGFPWGLLGHSQYTNLKLIQISDIFGAYGVSFVLVAFSAGIFSYFESSRKKTAPLVASLLFIVAATSYGTHRINNLHAQNSVKISVVQGNIPQDLKWDANEAEGIIKTYMEISRAAAKTGPDIVIWPETAYPYLIEEGALPDELGVLAKETATPLLFGAVSAENENYYNAAIFLGADGKVGGKYYKKHLVPFGEYIPLEKYLSILRSHVDKPIGDFKRGTSYTVFPVVIHRSKSSAEGIKTRETNFHKFGVMICFEDIFPYIASGFVKNGADFLVNITNDAWFGKTSAARQHLISSVFRAVENKVSVVRAANTGISCFIGPAGKIYSPVVENGQEIFVKGFSSDSVNVSGTRTPYTFYGDIFVYFCALLTVLLFFFEAFRASACISK